MDTFNYVAHQETYTVDVHRTGEKWTLLINGEPIQVEIVQSDDSLLILRFGNRIKTFYTAVEGGKRWVAYDGCTYLVERPSGRSRPKPVDSDAGRNLRAPMPSQVREVLVQPGDDIDKGATLLLLEAMKMEIRVQAPRAGKVAAVFVRQGESVELGSILIEFEEA